LVPNNLPEAEEEVDVGHQPEPDITTEEKVSKKSGHRKRGRPESTPEVKGYKRKVGVPARTHAKRKGVETGDILEHHSAIRDTLLEEASNVLGGIKMAQEGVKVLEEGLNVLLTSYRGNVA
jgi:hypothetical protein